MVNARRERVFPRLSSAGVLLLCICASACGPKRIVLPTDAGSPLSDYASIHSQIASDCSAVRSLSAEVSLSGRANGDRLRGTLHAGFRKPAAMRLEFHAPLLGTSLFVLAANDSAATLVLPRDNQVVRGPKAEDI